MNSLKNKTRLTAIALFTSCSIAYAAENNTTIQVESEQTKTTISQAELARVQWGLSEQEYGRYQELMKGIRGSISPSNISPIEVLGIHARNEAERKKYANLWAEAMQQDTARVLAFQKAYNEAWIKKQTDLIDTSKLELSEKEIRTSYQTDYPGKLILVTKLYDCPKCNDKLQQLLNALLVSNKATLDIYFSDSGKEGKGVIRQWAMENNVDTGMLKSKKLTLNHGASIIKQLNLSDDELPAVYKLGDKGGAERVE